MNSTARWLLPLVSLTLVMQPAVIRAQGDAARQRELESHELRRLIEEAPPAPLTGAVEHLDEVSARGDSRLLVGRDLATGQDVVMPGPADLFSGSRSVDGEDSLPPWDALAGEFDMPWIQGPSEEAEWSDARGSCTPPSPNLATHSFPWNTTYKLVMRFDSGGSDYYYSCSASSMGAFHLLTAGHCIYNHDPNDDGSTADADWAAEVWAWAAQTDYVNPFMGSPNPADRPYSFAKAVYLRTYTGWTGSADLNHDMGYITLDRSDGSHTGWMGREAGVEATTLNFNGYPAETPYVPAGEIRQYPGVDANNVNSYTTYRISMCAYVYGGHSGGPDWRFDGADRWVQGVNSTSNRVGSATATRITSDKFNDMGDIIDDDEVDRPPTDRPDLAEYFFTSTDDRKDLLDNTAAPGGQIGVEYSVLNAGFAASGPITVDFYLSTNAIISNLDTFIGSVNLGSLDAWTFVNPIATLNVPMSVPEGGYYVGWIMSGGVAEYGGDLDCTGTPCTNVAVIADEMLTVAVPCSPDAFEPDDTAGQASAISSGVPQVHGICPVGDEDWVTFSLGSPSEVVVETADAASGGDTRMWLYDSGLSLVEFDDDGGAGLFSHIDRQCGVDALAGGTYYVAVDEFGDNGEIEAYQLTYTVVDTCPTGCPDHLVLDHDTLTGTATYAADLTVTLGPGLIANGTSIEVIGGESIIMLDGTTIKGVFSAHHELGFCN